MDAPWTAERTDFLTRRIADGAPPSLIATELEVTRNAVLGKASRLGLQLAGKPGGAPKYTAEQDALITRRRQENASYDQIAKELDDGRTPKGIKARARRLKLPLRIVPLRTKSQNGLDLTTAQRIQAKARKPEPLALPAKLPVELPADAIPLTQRKNFLELGPRDCRYIYGETDKPDHFYCGGDTLPGCSWCRFHFKTVFYLPARRHF